jgi:hypothetical protein
MLSSVEYRFLLWSDRQIFAPPVQPCMPLQKPCDLS